MIGLTELMLILLCAEIAINIGAYIIIPRITKRRVMKAIREIDQHQVNQILESILDRIDLKEVEKHIMKQMSKQMGAIVGAHRSSASRAGKGFDKKMVKSLIENTPIGQALSIVSPEAKEYLIEHPAAVESVLFKWLPLMQRLRSQGGGTAVTGAGPMPVQGAGQQI